MDIVNGYVCHNCSDVALAKKGVDPAHPHDGPNGLQPQTPSDKTDVATKTGVVPGSGAQTAFGPTVTFGGALQGSNPTPNAASPGGAQAQAAAWPTQQPGQRVDLTA
jgi:hypothetical protein